MKKISFFFFVLLMIPTVCLAKTNSSAVKNQAFSQAVQQLVPLSPDQIKKFMDQLQDTDKAVYSGTPPKMINRTRRFSLEPGGDLPVIRITPGYVTSVAFFDSTGEPWPISSITVGNPNYYRVKKPKGLKPGNMITVTALKKHTSSNIVLTLQSHDMPLTVQLKSISSKKEGETDALIAFQADKRGPNAKTPEIGPTMKSTVDDIMLAFLDGVPPASAKPLNISKDVKKLNLWEYKGKLYLRTLYPLVWPAWSSIVNGVGGIRVYRMSQVPSLMISKDGNVLSLNIKKTD